MPETLLQEAAKRLKTPEDICAYPALTGEETEIIARIVLEVVEGRLKENGFAIFHKDINGWLPLDVAIKASREWLGLDKEE